VDGEIFESGKKIADSKISGYVWMGPKYPVAEEYNGLSKISLAILFCRSCSNCTLFIRSY